MTALVQVRVDKELKEQADALFNDLGLDTTTALRMFLKAAVREQKIPFALQKQQDDPIYNPKNVAKIKEAVKEKGKRITMTYPQLEQFCDAMEVATPQEAQEIVNKMLNNEYFND